MFKVANGPLTTECITRLWYIQIKSESSTNTYNNMDESHRPNIRGRKLDTKEYICYDTTCMKFKINPYPEVWIMVTLGLE